MKKLLFAAVVAVFSCALYGQTVVVGTGIQPVYTKKYTAQTATISPTVVLTAPSAGGVYRVSTYITVTATTATGGTLQPRVAYNDGANRGTLFGATIPASSTSGSAGGNQQSVVFVAGGQTLSVGVDDGATGGTATFNVYITVEQLQ